MKLEVKTVTPKMAEKWLERNHCENRILSQIDINAIAGDILAGRWKLTHQGICFDAEGNLIDGQHRLYGVVKAGIPVKMLVVVNDTASISDPIDTHRRRTASYLTGLRNNEIAACKVLHGLSNGGGYSTRMTSGESLFTYEKFATDFANIAVGKGRLLGGVLAAAVWSLPLSERVLSFVEQVHGGELIQRGDPAFALRSWLASNKNSLQPYETALATLNCITHQLCNKEMRAVYSGESGYRFITTKRRVAKIPNTPDASDVATLTIPGFER